MNDTQKSTAYHPALQLVFLILFAFVGAFVFSILGGAFWFVADPNASLSGMMVSNQAEMNLNFIKIIQIFSSIGIFIAGPIVFAFVNQKKPNSYYYFDQKLSGKLFVLVIAILFLSNPLFEFINELNQKMSLPAFLSNLELWMKAKETEADALTKQLLVMRNYGDLAINLLMIAVIPAIGEELFFRGGMQNIFREWFKNHHVAIWLTAIIFSAIHLQFYGFFPRMFLGALFGYLLVYGKSIWLPILGHFINNGTAVVMAFFMQQQGKSIDEIEKNISFNWYGYVISAIITLVLLVLFFKEAKKENSNLIYE